MQGEAGPCSLAHPVDRSRVNQGNVPVAPALAPSQDGRIVTDHRTAAHMSRRRFLRNVAVAGGAAALYETMVALGVAGPSASWSGPPVLDANQGDGQSVLILGAGIGGLTTAYILNQYGYRCRILEATHRAGGRNHTARRGAATRSSRRARSTDERRRSAISTVAST